LCAVEAAEQLSSNRIARRAIQTKIIANYDNQVVAALLDQNPLGLVCDTRGVSIIGIYIAVLLIKFVRVIARLITAADEVSTLKVVGQKSDDPFVNLIQ